jgi:hypothetical protein
VRRGGWVRQEVTEAESTAGLWLVQGWAPAVVVAQGVRLVASLVQRREQPNEPVRQEGTAGMGSEWRECTGGCILKFP